MADVFIQGTETGFREQAADQRNRRCIQGMNGAKPPKLATRSLRASGAPGVSPAIPVGLAAPIQIK